MKPERATPIMAERRDWARRDGDVSGRRGKGELRSIAGGRSQQAGRVCANRERPCALNLNPLYHESSTAW